jgi:hypothetical protein
MAFVNGGLGTGFGGLDQELLDEGITPRATMLKTTSFMNKRSLRAGSTQNAFARTPAKDKMSIDLLNQNENKGRNLNDLD